MAKLSAKSLSAGILISFLLPVMAAGQIISPVRLFGRYQQSIWQDQQGLPQNGISRIVQTPDGYLWLAIAEGLARFDGVRFTAFDTSNTPEIKSNNIQALFVDRAGTLWIRHAGRDELSRRTLYALLD
jgi:ligand-binding sensor domain-containing protein